MLAAVLCPWLGVSLMRLEASWQARRLGHAWLIGGARGIGKANLAYALADRMLRQQSGSPLPPGATPGSIVEFYDSLEREHDLHPDLHRVRVPEDKKSIAIDQIRELTADLVLTPHMAGLKFVVIETADLMTTAAANALLKSLEEPTADTYLFLLAERPGRLPATIRSRCHFLSLQGSARTAASDWLKDARLDPAPLPPTLVQGSPIIAARLLMSIEETNKYKVLHDDINLVFNGQSDPYAVAGKWLRGDTSLAIDCLVDRLRRTIRNLIAPGHSKPITDSASGINENIAGSLSVFQLFDGLQIAENLREQLGRGLNVELALTALLRGLEPVSEQRVNQ